VNLEGGSPQERLPQGSHHPLPDPGRSSASDLARDVERARGSRLVATLLDAADTSLMVLNPRREIVAANASAASLRPLPEIIGLRPGEALSCVVAGGPGGCGTTAHCETCGALGAILASQERGRPVGAECLMRSELGAGAALEQVFFHDVLNTVAARGDGLLHPPPARSGGDVSGAPAPQGGGRCPGPRS
jgi:hypothetical protein